jgi:hypothetical protein
VHLDILICYNGLKVVLRSEKHHLWQLPHPLSSPEISLGDLWSWYVQRNWKEGTRIELEWRNRRGDYIGVEESAFHFWWP